MQTDLFSLDAESEGLQPTVVTCSPEELVERQFGVSIAEAIESALWAGGFEGTLSRRLNLAEDLRRRFLLEFRNDPAFGAELARGTDLHGNLTGLLRTWVREAVRP